MILIRGIYGEDYAKRINEGIVGFGDLLSVLLKPAKTGYARSDYEESYIRQLYAEIFEINEYKQGKRYNEYLDSALTTNQFVPNLFLSSFHILNDKSLKWLNDNFDDKANFVFIIPILHCFNKSKNCVYKNIIGREMQYVNSYNDYGFVDFEMSTIGLTSIVNDDLSFSKLSNFDAISSYIELTFNTFKAVFTRVVDDKYDESENEFRFVYKPNNKISSKGVLYPNEDRRYTFCINGIKYIGMQITEDFEGYIRPDIFLVPLPPANANITPTTYLSEFVKEKEISLDRSFIDVDIKPIAKKYGYIGNKADCQVFIEKYLSNKHFEKTLIHS